MTDMYWTFTVNTRIFSKFPFLKTWHLCKSTYDKSHAVLKAVLYNVTCKQLSSLYLERIEHKSDEAWIVLRNLDIKHPLHNSSL